MRLFRFVGKAHIAGLYPEKSEMIPDSFLLKSGINPVLEI